MISETHMLWFKLIRLVYKFEFHLDNSPITKLTSVQRRLNNKLKGNHKDQGYQELRRSLRKKTASHQPQSDVSTAHKQNQERPIKAPSRKNERKPKGIQERAGEQDEKPKVVKRQETTSFWRPIKRSNVTDNEKQSSKAASMQKIN